MSACSTVSTRAPQFGHGPPTAACAVGSPTARRLCSTRCARSRMESLAVVTANPLSSKSGERKPPDPLIGGAPPACLSVRSADSTGKYPDGHCATDGASGDGIRCGRVGDAQAEGRRLLPVAARGAVCRRRSFGPHPDLASPLRAAQDGVPHHKNATMPIATGRTVTTAPKVGSLRLTSGSPWQRARKYRDRNRRMEENDASPSVAGLQGAARLLSAND